MTRHPIPGQRQLDGKPRNLAGHPGLGARHQLMLLRYHVPMTSIAERLLTADEFLVLPGAPDGGKMELVEGRVLRMSPVGDEHGEVAWRLSQRLAEFAHSHKLGRVRQEVGFVLAQDPDTVRQPDVWFLSQAAEPADHDRRKFIPAAPTLAVEIVSPNDRQVDILRRVGEYLDAGSARVWVVRPGRQTVAVYRQDGSVVERGGADLLSSDDAGFETPGFELVVADVFGEA